MAKPKRTTHRTIAARPIPRLTGLLASTRTIGPAVPDLEALIEKWSAILSGRRAFTMPGDLTLTQRRKHLRLAAERLDRARAALSEVPLHDQVYVCRNGGGEDLDARLAAASRACLGQEKALRGTPRFSDPVRPRVASDVRAVLEKHGIRCSRYRGAKKGGLFAAVLKCCYRALGLKAPKDMMPYLRATARKVRRRPSVRRAVRE